MCQLLYMYCTLSFDMYLAYQRMRPTLHAALAQYVTVRNERGREMLDLVRQRLIVTPTSASGDRKPFVLQTVQSDDECDPCHHSHSLVSAF